MELFDRFMKGLAFPNEGIFKLNCQVFGGFMKYLTEPFKAVKCRDGFFVKVGEMMSSPTPICGF